ncbi:MAG: hypothetical protein U9N13_05930 [Euryarchaeota archaeon]|nr:hypothetical protein [Euryarchaeota archaeon]
MATVLLAAVFLNFFGNIFTHTGIEMVQTLSTLSIISIDLVAFGQYSQYLIYAAIGCSAWLAAIISAFVAIETFGMARTYMRSGVVSRSYSLSSLFSR